MRIGLLIAGGILAAGCATKPVSDDDVKPIPAKRVIESSWLSERPGTLPVIIKRDAEYRVLGCVIRIFVDGQPVADLYHREGGTFYIDKGDRILAAQLCPKAAGGGTVELLADISEGKHLKFRVSSGAGGDSVTIQPTSF